MLRRLIDQMAARTAEEINVAALCQALGARKETVNDYIDILTRLGIVHRLGAWTSSGAKREIKAPKLHFLDTGCATALRGEDSGSFGLGADPTALGHLLESFVYTELEKSLAFLSKRWRLHHWRLDSRKVDIVAEAPGKLLALFEMKAASTVDVQDFRHSQLLSFGPGRIAVPVSMLWSFKK